jgi:hypothetical protein
VFYSNNLSIPKRRCPVRLLKFSGWRGQVIGKKEGTRELVMSPLP